MAVTRSVTECQAYGACAYGVCACATCVANAHDVATCQSFGLDCKCAAPTPSAATALRKAQAAAAVSVTVAVNVEENSAGTSVFDQLLRCLQTTDKADAVCINLNKQQGA
jgi:hypothetical protein